MRIALRCNLHCLRPGPRRPACRGRRDFRGRLSSREQSCCVPSFLILLPADGAKGGEQNGELGALLRVDFADGKKDARGKGLAAGQVDATGNVETGVVRLQGGVHFFDAVAHWVNSTFLTVAIQLTPIYLLNQPLDSRL